MYGLNMYGLIALIGHERASVTKVANWSIAGGISGVVEGV